VWRLKPVTTTTWEANTGKITVLVQPGKKFTRPYFQRPGEVVCTCHLSYTKITVEACPGIKQYPISKITKAKRAGRVAEVVEHLLHKLEVLSSASVPPEKGARE
jgi:hypothetical protein